LNHLAPTGSVPFVDSHAHLADPAFDADREVVIENARRAGTLGIVCIGESITAGERAAALAARHAGFVWFTAGVHPHDAADFDETRDGAAIRDLAMRGAVAIFRTAPTGERAVLTVVRPPDVLGEVSLLDAATRSASAEAIEDCQALTLSRAAFMDLVHSNPRILDAVMRSVGALIRRLTEQNTDHVFLDLPGRVAKTLVRLAGESQAPMITIELNQSQLAEMAGGSRQSVNQAIGSFASRGWLRTEGRRIVVTDLAALRRRAGMTDR